MPFQNRIGMLEVHSGCVGAGKTLALIRELRLAEISVRTAGRVLAFRPKRAGHPDPERLVSNDETTYPCRAVAGPEELMAFMVSQDPPLVIGIDEAHLFPPGLVEVCDRLASQGRRVIVSGLDLDENGRPYVTTMHLVALADSATKHYAVCVKCNGVATRSRRRRPAAEDPPAGTSIGYEALCRHCDNVLTGTAEP